MQVSPAVLESRAYRASRTIWLSTTEIDANDISVIHNERVRSLHTSTEVIRIIWGQLSSVGFVGLTEDLTPGVNLGTLVRAER